MTLPRRILDSPTRQKKWRSPAHRAWVRSHLCCVPGCDRRPIEAAHVRTGTGGGVGMKPDATIAALKQEVERLTVDNDALTTTMDDCVQERLDEMSVEAADFDKDVWRALCSYLKDRKGFSWHDYEDGIHAEDVIEFLRGCDEAAESSLAEKDAQLQAKEAVIAEQHRQLNYFRSSLAASRAVVEAARAHFKDAVVMLYEHGGGRVYRIDEKGSRDLIIDLYEPAERRDAILAALTAAPPADVKEDR